MKIIGEKLINDTKVPMIVECTSIEVEDSRGYHKDFNPNNCRLWMRGTHPNISYFIIKTDKRSNGGYYWLDKTEVEAIMKCAAEFDVIDLRKFGDYQICAEGRIQSVFIMNDIDDWTDEDRPILVKVVDDKDGE